MREKELPKSVQSVQSDIMHEFQQTSQRADIFRRTQRLAARNEATKEFKKGDEPKECLVGIVISDSYHSRGW